MVRQRKLDLVTDPLRIYGGEAKFRAALGRHLATGRDLLDVLEGVKRRMAGSDRGPTGLHAELIEAEWIADVEQWQTRALRAAVRHLQDGAEGQLPTLGLRWPPDTGKPRHRRSIEWIEPWLRESIDETQRLRDSLHGQAPPAAAPAPAVAAPSRDPLDRVRALLGAGETPTVEFKSTLGWSVQGGVRDTKLHKMVTKTIAAFANTNGGTLVIGARPDGAVVGLEPDCADLRRGSDTCIDAFSRTLSDVLSSHLGRAVAAWLGIEYVAIDGRVVCLIDVPAIDRALYLRTDGNEEFYVRSGATSIPLLMSEAHDYLRRRFS